MAELRVVLTNESDGETSSNLNEQPTTTTGQQKIEKAKLESPKTTTAKEIATISLAVASAGVNLITQASMIQASLNGNSAYSQQVADTSKVLNKVLSIGGSFITGTALSGGNFAIGGATAIISAVTNVASTMLEINQVNQQNYLTRQSENIQTFRLGNANNIWRK